MYIVHNYTHTVRRAWKKYENDFSRVQLCVRRENNFSKSFHQVFFFFSSPGQYRREIISQVTGYYTEKLLPNKKEKKKKK